MNEIWKPVIGFEGIYSISNMGNVRRDLFHPNTKVGLILKPHETKRRNKNIKGYLFVLLRRKNISIHRMIARIFFGDKPKGFQVNHKDGDKHNNCVNNLEYVSRSENANHAYKLGLQHWGEKHPFSKLTVDQVRIIKNKYDGSKNFCRIF